MSFLNAFSMLYIVRCYIHNTNDTLPPMRNLLQTKVGLRIKDLRAAEDISQERFANKIGMDRTYLASIEVGQRNVTLQNLAKIANGFDMTLSEFFEGIPRIDPAE